VDEYIRLESLCEKIQKRHQEIQVELEHATFPPLRDIYSGNLRLLMEFLAMAQDMRDIDTIHVVRCKDCKHCTWYTKVYQLTERKETEYWCSCNKGRPARVTSDHFCSCGERENNEMAGE